MTKKTFVLLDGREMTTEETIQHLLLKVRENNNMLRELSTDIDLLINRVNELQASSHDHDEV